jgi:predicted RNA polymerase sigma factor
VTDTDPAAQAVEDVVRASYGRLVAYLVASSRDVSAAEDALSEALTAALRTWPTRGVPDHPEAWLLTTARRQLIGRHRRAEVAARAAPTLQLIDEEIRASAQRGWSIPDQRLELCFVCAHPAIDARLRAPLMLQVVLGLDASRIASAFLVAPATMGQRLSRAKAKIRAAGIAFEIPDHHQLPARLDSVLEAIYGAFTAGWSDPAGLDPRQQGLAEEAIRLARVVVDLLPQESEPEALLATMLFAHARRAARRDPDGRFVPLPDQDPRQWDPADLLAAEAHLARAATAAAPTGRFQLEGAIQSLHARQVVTGQPEWVRILDLYDRLLDLAPTVGAAIAAAAAAAEVDGPDEGLRRLAALPEDRVADHQGFWAVTAHLLRHRGDDAPSEVAFRRAAGLTDDPAVRAFLLERSRPGAGT